MPSQPIRRRRPRAPGVGAAVSVGAALAGATALAAVLAAVLAGCSAPDDEPAPVATSPRPAGSVLAPPSPTSAMPTVPPLPTPPADMARDDEVGAVAAARYFLDLYAYTESTQDTGPWEAMSHDDCVFCRSVLDDVATQVAAGQVTHSAAMSITSQEIEELNPLAFAISLIVTKRPEELWTLDGQFVAAGDDVGGGIRLIVVRHPDSWLVREVSTFDPKTN